VTHRDSISLPVVLVRGGGDLASGVVHRLFRSGFMVVVLELPEPTLLRAAVSFGSAVDEGEVEVEGVRARRVERIEAAVLQARKFVPVAVDPVGDHIRKLRPDVVVDARMAKERLDTRIGDAPMVIALGPGFVAGRDVHAVVETRRGHDLGRVIREGAASPDTGEPESVLGVSASRVIRATSSGRFHRVHGIGDLVGAGEEVGLVLPGSTPVLARTSGVIRGLLHEGRKTLTGMKVGDVDPRADTSLCFRISDKARAVGGGVLEAILTGPIRNA
jgi:xanthine dehydrogenase accessory factor